MPKTTQKTHKFLSTYKDLYETYPYKDKVDKNVHRLVQKTFNNLLLHSMVEEGKVYNLPYSGGYLGIFTKDDRPFINYQHYKETGEKLSFPNLHSEQRMARFLLRGPKSSSPTAGVHKFKIARKPARDLAQLIKHKNYITKYFSYETYFD